MDAPEVPAASIGPIVTASNRFAEPVKDPGLNVVDLGDSQGSIELRIQVVGGNILVAESGESMDFPQGSILLFGLTNALNAFAETMFSNPTNDGPFVNEVSSSLRTSTGVLLSLSFLGVGRLAWVRGKRAHTTS